MDPVQPSSDVERLYPDPESGPYHLRLWFGEVDGQPGVVGVELWGVTPQIRPWLIERELPAKHIESADTRLPLGAELNRWTVLQYQAAEAALGPEFLTKAAKSWPDLPLLQARKDAAFAAARQEAKDRLVKYGNRRAVPDSRLRAVADQYRQAVIEGSHAPAEAVGIYLEELGVKVNPATLRGWISKARKRGYLPPNRRSTAKEDRHGS